ncbi:MAG: hypothetical protein AAF590_13665, partial [Pseudomonadota bacterium]
MNSIAGCIGAMAFVVGAAIYPQKSVADGFTGEEFLTWSESGQNNYIGTSVTMATMVASRTNTVASDCLDQWYAASEEVAQMRNREMRDAISRNSEFHPSAVILLIL